MSAAVAGASSDSCPQTGSESAGQRIMRQDKDNDIKDYAENTMNELLGWYGYDKLDTRGMNFKNLGHPFPASSSSSSSPIRAEDDASEEDTAQSVSPGAENDSTPLNSSGGNTIICAWCLKMGLKLFTLKTASGETKEFCSEPCFNQCRRAAFKKNRVCNWCRHVRHTVNYVDFQDGDEQLQFCSDKCLNQYKMQIFCKETQAYLQMNPHLQEESSKNAASSKLITPDLWLRDCHESTNGGVNCSEDESQTKQSDKGELEDLSIKPKSETNTIINQTFHHEVPKQLPTSIKENLVERCNTLASYLSDEKIKSDRRKRLHENHRESSRKRQRISSFRNKSNHTSEAPPAHLSSVPSSLTFQNQTSIFSPASASFPLPLRSKSPEFINPPVAHSKSFNPHPNLVSSVLHPGLPPPPPLLNNDFYHSSYNPSIFSSHQQQLDAVLRMQAGYPPSTPFTPSFFHDSMLPLLRGAAQPDARPIPQPNTVMLPYPIFVPLPVPIPIPLPLKCFLPKDKPTEKNSNESEPEIHTSNKKESERTDNDFAKNSKNIADDSISSMPNSKTQLSTTSSIDSEYEEHKSIKKTKRR